MSDPRIPLTPAEQGNIGVFIACIESCCGSLLHNIKDIRREDFEALKRAYFVILNISDRAGGITSDAGKKHEEELVELEAAHYKQLLLLHDVKFISARWTLDSSITRNGLFSLVDCLRSTVLSLMLSLELPKFTKKTPPEKPKRTTTKTKKKTR